MSSQKIANPAPLGLARFGFTTVLLNLVNIGLVGGALEKSLVMTIWGSSSAVCASS